MNHNLRFYIVFISGLLFLPALCHAQVSMDADTIPPQVIISPQDSTINCGIAQTNALLQSWYNNHAGMQAEDDSGSMITYISSPSLDSVLLLFNTSNPCGNTKTVSVDFVAKDSSGNETEPLSASFSTVDTRGPTITRNAFPGFSFCNEELRDTLWNWMVDHGGAVAIDNCGNVSWNRYIFSDNLGNFSNGELGIDSIAIPDGICNWVATVSFIAEDECGNQSVTTSAFTVIDNLDPTLSSYPSDTTYGCDMLPLPNNIVGFDNCTVNPSVRYSEVENRIGDETLCDYYNYSITRTWIVEDNCGNTSSHVQVVNIEDRRGPTFTLIDSVNIDCIELNDTDAFFLPTDVNDDCSSVITTYQDSVIGEGCSYEVLRTYTFSDICGNQEVATQRLFVQDSTPPSINNVLGDYIVDCEESNVLSFSGFVDSRLTINASDECSEVFAFAAEPGSYDLQDPSTYPGIFPGELDSFACGEALPGFLIFQEVDFVYYDNCNNATFYRASYGIRDSVAPEITNCPPSDTLVIEEGECYALYSLSTTEVIDDCVDLDTLIERNARVPLFSTSPGDPDIPVNTATIELTDFSNYFLNITEPATLHIRVNNADIDDPNEYFIIVSENNDSLARTPLAEVQCGSVEFEIEVSPNDLNNWLADGVVRLLFLQNASAEINDICSTSSIEVTLSFSNPLGLSVEREIYVDGAIVENNVFLDNNQLQIPAGMHDVMEVVYDCAGNSDTCEYQLLAIDQEPPVLSCDNDMVTLQGREDCRGIYQIPFQYSISDNCLFNKVYRKQLPASGEKQKLAFSETASGELIAEDMSFLFTETFPVRNTTSPAELNVIIKADIDQAGELFEIRAEDGSTIGFLNNNGGSNCVGVSKTFSIDIEDINKWSADGEIEISMIAIEATDAIDPCGIIDADGFDPESYVAVTLQYSDAIIEYKLSESTDTDWEEVILFNDSISVRLNGSENTFLFRTFDHFGNGDTCSMEIQLIDGFSPSAVCQPAVIFLDPSGVEDYILNPEEVNGGSFDNCTLDSLAVEPSIFTCDNLGQQVEVTLFAVDNGGNVDSCSTSVMVRTPVIEPFYEIDLCNADTLKLFANAPPTSIANAYTYRWSGPGFESLLANPTIPNVTEDNNGTYTVEITGFNGCSARGTVEVNIEQLGTPVIETDRNEVCRGEEILLTTQGLNGEVSYLWYQGTYPDGLLLETTQTPSYLAIPGEGGKFYYLIVRKDGCESNPSAMKRVDVIDPPELTVQEEFITVCEGEPIVIGTDVVGDNISYQWTGPNQFTSDQRIPDTIPAASSLNEGTYNLIVSIGGCVSDTASLLVTVFPKPIQPIIDGGDTFCEGSTITFTVNNLPNADLYTWYQDGIEKSTTPDNTLVLNNADSSLSGLWSVRVSDGICSSDLSSAIQVVIEDNLLVSANNNGPGCVGDSVTLNASFVPDATYRWAGPNEFTNNQQSPTIPAIPGSYSVTITTPAGCSGEASTIVTTTEAPEITALSSDAPNCVSGNEMVTFFPTIIPARDYTYEWTGPNNYSADSLNASIQDVTQSDNGTYALVVISGNCRSEMQSIDIEVTDIPPKPIITGDTAYCIDEDLILFTEESGQDATYLWNTPQGQKTSNTPDLNISDLVIEDRGNYSVAVDVNGCRSVFSEPVTISIGSIPFNPVIASNAPICPGDTLQLMATLLNNVTYQWQGPNGFVSNEVNPTIIDFNSDNEGDYVVAVSKDGCTVRSNTISVQLNNPPSPPVPTISEINLCNNDSTNLELCVEPYSEEVTYILFRSDDDTEIARSAEPCITIDNLSGLSDGINLLHFRTENQTCISEESPSIEVRLSEPPIIDAELEENNLVSCDAGPITLTSLFGSPEVEVKWEAITEGLLLNKEEGQSIDISNLQVGRNEVLYSYSTDFCDDFTSGIGIINRVESPEANDDQISIEGFDPVVLPVFDNDVIIEDIGISISDQPEYGTAIVQEGGILYSPDPRFVGTIIFSYQLCVPDCDQFCQEASVTISIGDVGECTPPSIITPNGDGYNDYFVIPCLSTSRYPGNTLIIYNQWGSALLEETEYRNDWDGTYNGEELPVGTYYYILDLADGTKPMVGFIIIER